MEKMYGKINVFIDDSDKQYNFLKYFKSYSSRIILLEKGSKKKYTENGIDGIFITNFDLINYVPTNLKYVSKILLIFDRIEERIFEHNNFKSLISSIQNIGITIFIFNCLNFDVNSIKKLNVDNIIFDKDILDEDLYTSLFPIIPKFSILKQIIEESEKANTGDKLQYVGIIKNFMRYIPSWDRFFKICFKNSDDSGSDNLISDIEFWKEIVIEI